MTTNITDYAKVVGVSPGLIQIEVTSTDEYSRLDIQLEIGSYLKVSDDNGCSVVAVVQSFRIRDRVPAAEEDTGSPTFVLDAQPVGRLEHGVFRRGGKQITIPPRRVEVATADVLADIYSHPDCGSPFFFSTLVQNPDVRVVVDGDRFFGKHIGVVGSTGSGKSCTVAKILQEGIRASDAQAKDGVLNNSHAIIFDLHGEYAPAFPAARVLDVDALKLPYWLMNSEELEEMFIESGEQNSHNQVSQFRQAVVDNKQRHAGAGQKVSYDSPIYFSLIEVMNYLANLNNEMIEKFPSEGCPKLSSGELVAIRAEHYFDARLTFHPSSSIKELKVGNGPFHGEFDRFLMRLQARVADKRLDFLLSPSKIDGSEYETEDTLSLIQTLTGYGESRSNITIIDLSGIPFEVLSVVVSLVTRLIFTFAFHLRKSGQTIDHELPFLLVYEEAHNYVPQSEGARYKSVKKSVERIAKEGRKYGISLMIVSQRPSEISETVFSQCNTFVAMRLTNPADQRYVQRLLPDSLATVTDSLPTLEGREAIVLGDALPIPSLVKIDTVMDRPHSDDVAFHREWQKDWWEIEMEIVLDRWR